MIKARRFAVCTIRSCAEMAAGLYGPCGVEMAHELADPVIQGISIKVFGEGDSPPKKASWKPWICVRRLNLCRNETIIW